jgi:Glycine-zipper domain
MARLDDSAGFTQGGRYDETSASCIDRSALVAMSGCADITETQQRTLMGGAAGAAGGAVIGAIAGNAGLGAAIGAGAGLAGRVSLRQA